MLRVLRHMQRPMRLAWDANASATGVLFALLPADWWVLDLRAGNEQCAVALGGAPGSWAATRRAVDRACAQTTARTIVRHLVIPGHVECCTRPVLAWLAAAHRRGRRFTLNLLDGYLPLHRAGTRPGLDRRPSRIELEDARALARAAKLPLVSGRGA
jgi:putative pyruvate formate lyase activating enzyme